MKAGSAAETLTACHSQAMQCVEEAVRLAGEAAQIAAATDWLSLHADRLVDLGIVLRLEERMDEAVSRLEQALRLYERKGNLVGAARSRALLETGQPRPT